MPRIRSSAKSGDAPGPPAAPPAEVTLAEWEARKNAVGFGVRDIEILRELHLVARTYADDVVEEVYDRWLLLDGFRVLLKDEETIARVKALQKRYFLELTGGAYGAEYLDSRLRVGRTHRAIGLPDRWHLPGYSIYLQRVVPRVLAGFEYNRAKTSAAITALVKLVLLDMELVLFWRAEGQESAQPQAIE